MHEIIAGNHASMACEDLAQTDSRRSSFLTGLISLRGDPKAAVLAFADC